MTGSDYERTLAKHLADRGYAVVRAPSSGGGTTRSLPDVCWSRHDITPIAAELKTVSDAPAYVSKAEAESLREFAAAFNAAPRFLLREKGDTSYYVIDPSDAPPTDKSYRLEKDAAIRTINP